MRKREDKIRQPSQVLNFLPSFFYSIRLKAQAQKFKGCPASGFGRDKSLRYMTVHVVGRNNI
ncbi:MAG: hypothetical protein JRI93_08575 [Deltaproteobacteria bacterium]|nr:hypothetical protein [Deltaproteobacteria bacterium]